MIVLLRHTHTELSFGKRLIGQYDVPLSNAGMAESESIAEALKGFHFSHIVSSALSRSRRMAEMIAACKKQSVQAEAGFNEICLGAWDGSFIEDIKNKYPQEYTLRGQDMIRFRPPEGENFADLKKRVKKSFHRILQQEGSLLIVAHASVNRVILGEALEIPLNRILSIFQDYGCCNVLLQQGDDFSVKLINGKIASLKGILEADNETAKEKWTHENCCSYG
jgi:probable phosphoglycerate mutase